MKSWKMAAAKTKTPQGSAVIAHESKVEGNSVAVKSPACTAVLLGILNSTLEKNK